MTEEKVASKLDRERSDVGVEFGRVVAAYGVVVIHSSFGRGSAMSPSAANFTNIFYFAVPFFLATSYYYVWKSLQKRSPWLIHKTRIYRLLWPYVAWTTIYLITRIGFYAASNNQANALKLSGSALESFFFGSAAVQLYYVPLLVSGFFWIYFAKILKLSGSALGCGVMVCVGLVGAEWLVRSGNGFGPGEIGFEALIPEGEAGTWRWLRAPLSVMACIIQTAPTFFGAGLLYTLERQGKFHNLATKPLYCWMGIILIITGLVFFQSFPQITTIAGIGFLGCLLKMRAKANLVGVVAPLGALSAGCYFAHHLILEAFQILIRRLLPEFSQHNTLFSVVILSGVATAVTFATVYKLQRMGAFGRLLAAV